MGDRLATIHVGRKVGACCAHFRWGAGSPSNTMSPGPRPTSVPSGILIHSAVWPEQTWTENWGLCPLWGGRASLTSNTTWPGRTPTSIPSGIVIHPTVWPQYTNVTTQTVQTDRQRSDRIRRTVFTARRNARIASAVLAIAIPSVCSSVCLSHASIV